MRLLFRKNKFLSYDKQSGQLCPGFNKCVHPGSIGSNKVEGFKDEPKRTIISCRFKRYIGPCGVALSNYTRAKWEEFERKHTFCWHPDEITRAQEWRCYKCNTLVKSERERHKCR